MSTIVGIVICVSVAPDVVSGAVELVVASGVVSSIVVFEAASPDTAVVVTRMPPSKGVISAVALVTCPEQALGYPSSSIQKTVTSIPIKLFYRLQNELQSVKRVSNTQHRHQATQLN